MILFLDVVSPIPEIHLINDKIILDSFKIGGNIDQKLSDHLIPTYLKISNLYELPENITKLIVTIGPGSYTALRVGASFIAGLKQSLNIPVAMVSLENIYNYLNKSNKPIGIYFESSNKQNFFSYMKGKTFVHDKIENDNYQIPKSTSFIYYNLFTPKFLNKKIESENFSTKNIVLKNLDLLEFSNNHLIKPIYISNNSILN
tara:strand:- start:410 stop:1015 length:606 start_codon:yes stop_codon:yes gene_type:complete